MSRAKRQGFCEHPFMLIFGLTTNHRKFQGAILTGSSRVEVHGYDKK